jgi:glycosyl transferase family 4
VTRVALLDHAAGPYASELVGSLRAVGIEADLLGPQAGARAAERLLGRRGFADGLAHVPLATARLLRGRFDVAHAFTAADAFGALAARRPVVFTCTEPLDRGSLADRRLRLHMLERATQDADAVLAAGEDVAASMQRWLAIDAAVLDASGYARLYGELLARRG